MLQINQQKRSTLAAVIRHPWVNIGHVTLPVDYMELGRDEAPIIATEWAEMILKATVRQAGCILMDELNERIPSRRLSTEIQQELNGENITDEDDSNDDGDKFLSKMTIMDKKKSKIWWKRLWHHVSRAFMKDAPTASSMRISVREIFPRVSIVTKPERQRIVTDTVVQTFPMESKRNHTRHRFWGFGRK
jgi:hypothetical protein